MKLYQSILSKTEYWINEEKKKTQSIVGNLIKYIENGNLREPQIEAIKVYLWLKFVGNNQKISTLIKQGKLYDDEQAKEYEYYHTFGNNFVTHYLNQFAQDNGLKKLTKQLVGDPNGKEINWDVVLEDLLHNYEYPNYLFSLPMGAGKTYLMACFIYLDLYFSKQFKNDNRFANNFVIFAPQSTKTAILPSLQTIKNFNPEWVLPKTDADSLRQVIQIEILDALSSKRKDKLQGNNPNLEKVNRLTQSKSFGLVFITNAEKVVLEQYSDSDKLIVDPNSVLYDETKASEIIKYNDLREKLSQIPSLGVILDEVHHTYGTTESGEKKLRSAVNILNQQKNVINVIGMSGTPYSDNVVKIEDDEIKLNQIQDIVYNYPLNQGIGRFLKVPDIRKREVNEITFIKEALFDFFNEFDVNYPNGTKSKQVFYCPSISKLNEEIMPIILEWYQENRNGRENEIFKYYSTSGSGDIQYKLPKDSLAIFNNLDKPYSEKRIVLLVAVGTEGWDCKSLTSVVLPRKETSKNFVLQTTCRCLREVQDAKNEKALICLGDGNYEILNNQLKENYHLSVTDLKEQSSSFIRVQIRKPKLGKLKYKQISTSYQIIKKTINNPKKTLSEFDFGQIKLQFAYNPNLTRAKLGEDKLIEETRYLQYAKGNIDFTYSDFIYELAQSTLGNYSESELIRLFNPELNKIYAVIQVEKDWLIGHPNLDTNGIVKIIASSLAESFEYKTETIENEAEIQLLEWDIPSPEMSLLASSGIVYKFVPNISADEVKNFLRHPEDLDDERKKIDSRNISFNYLPYKMDSDFERIAFTEMLKMVEFTNLELYFNGYNNGLLQSFWIQTPDGVYTPDFLVLKRFDGEISKVLILETKGRLYYDEEFRRKEKFVKESFLKRNPSFNFECFIDEGQNIFENHIERLREILRCF